MISARDLDHLAPVPDVAKPTALWLWLNLDPMGRGLLDPHWIASEMHPTEDPDVASERVLDHLLMLMDAGFLTTYNADSAEWILLLHPLKTDLRRTKIQTPDPPRNRPWTSMAVGGGRARARERARAQVRAEDAARADAWDAVRADRESAPEQPQRPIVLDAPPMFCDDHMPHGAGQKKCGPCRDTRLLRDEWLARRVYEDQLAQFNESLEVDDDEPF
nr:hypothetical protein [Microbacterium bovistercoris]